MANGNIVYAIATSLVALKTPTMLSEFMISANAPKVSTGVRYLAGMIKRK